MQMSTLKEAKEKDMHKNNSSAIHFMLKALGHDISSNCCYY